jgi:hypothetical protein
MKSLVKIFALALAFFNLQSSFAQSNTTDQEDVRVIQLSQTPGEYETVSLNLKPGKYIFEVTNRNVDKKLGFYLTPAGDEKAQVPNSGLQKLVNKGETSRTSVVELSVGDYQYSCPLNPTPHYSLTVAE